MLSHEEIIKRCQSQECFIVMNFNATGKRVIPISEYHENEGINESLIDSALKAVRMQITLGPVVKKHNKTVKRSHRFKGRKNLIDLTACDGSVIVGPRETVSILSNEYFKFNGTISAIIIPRLTLADVGLSLIPTYIDPYWDGILQMSLINNTSAAFELKLGEPIAQCFFFNVRGKVPIKYKDSFPRTSHHFGQTWEKIINEDSEPFPRRKRVEELGFFARLSYLARSYKIALPVLSFAGLIIGGVFSAGKLYNSISIMEEQVKKIPKLQEKITEVGELQAKDSRRLVTKGVQKIVIAANENSSTIRIPVNIDIVGNPVILSDIKNKSIVSRYRVTAGKIENGILKEVIIFIELSAPAKKDVMLDVQWVVIP